MRNKCIQVFKTTIQKIYKVPKFSSDWQKHYLIILQCNLPLNAKKE